MEPHRPTGSRPAMPPYELAERRPWHPPSQPPPTAAGYDRAPDTSQVGGERVAGDYQQYGNYGGHYVGHSQYYHPESQRRRHRQPESFWFSHPQQPPRPADPWEQPPLVPPHTTPRVTPPPPPPGDIHRAPLTHHSQHYPPLPPPHTVFTQDRVPPLPYPAEPPAVAPPLAPPPSNTTGRVSSVDLIQATQGRDYCRESEWEPRGSCSEGVMEGSGEDVREGSRKGVMVGSGEGVMEGSGEGVWGARSDGVPQREELVKQDEGEARGGVDIGKERVEETRGQLLKHSTEEEEEEEEGMREYEGSFVAEVRRFVHRHSVMFDIVTDERLAMETVPTLHNLKSEESFKYSEPEALEYHMKVDKTVRRHHFFTLVEPGDVIRGHVVAKRHGGLMVQITSFVNSHKYRELPDLSIRGAVIFENLAEDRDKCDDVMGDMQLDDVVQALVLEVGLAEELLELSFRNNGSFPGVDTASLGYRHGRRPVSPRPDIIARDEFLHCLEVDPGFTNPEAVNNLFQHLGLTSSSLRPTLLRDLQTADYSEEDFAEPLRKEQRFKWSMKTVAVGVDHFKSGKHTSAMQYFNHALDIDPSNVEGLVARGALLSTTGKYREGIADFRSALSIKNTHRNARNYFVEIQVVLGKELEEQGKIDSAMECYREALTLDPDQGVAKERVEAITAAIEAKTARLREREKEEQEEREKMEKIRKVIEKEKKKRLKDKRTSKAKKRKKGEDGGQRRHKKRSKSSKRCYTSSEASSDSEPSSEEEEEDDDREGRRRRGGRKRGRGERERRKEKRKHGSHSRSKSSKRRVTSSSEETASDEGRGEKERRREGEATVSKEDRGEKERRREGEATASDEDRGEKREGGNDGNRTRKNRSKYSSEDTSSVSEGRGGSEVGRGGREGRRKPPIAKSSPSQDISSSDTTNSDSRTRDKSRKR